MTDVSIDPATDLILTRTLNAPRALLWECWTSPEHVPHWFIPKPHRITACEIDLRTGGKFNTTFEVDGNEIANNGVFLEVIEGRKLVFTDGYSEGWKPAPEPFMTAIVTFEDAGEGKTTYTAIARHRSPEAAKSHEEMGFSEGWGTVATQLEAYAQGLAGQ